MLISVRTSIAAVWCSVANNHFRFQGYIIWLRHMRKYLQYLCTNFFNFLFSTHSCIDLMVFWYATLCSLVGSYLYFGRTCRFHLQGRKFPSNMFIWHNFESHGTVSHGLRIKNLVSVHHFRSPGRGKIFWNRVFGSTIGITYSKQSAVSWQCTSDQTGRSECSYFNAIHCRTEVSRGQSGWFRSFTIGSALH